jgi:hypothetical protein
MIIGITMVENKLKRNRINLMKENTQILIFELECF